MRWIWRGLLSVIFSIVWVYLVANWIKPVIHDLTLRFPYEETLTNIWVPVLVLLGVLVIAHRNSLFLPEEIAPRVRIAFMIVTFGVSLLVSVGLLLGPLGMLPTYDTLVDVTKLRVPAL